MAGSEFVLGLTGGIACGKTRAAAHLKRLGACVIDADEISRELTSRGGAALGDIRAAFGDGVFADERTLDREALAEIVFTNEEKRRVLERILHPAVQNEMLRLMEEARERNEKVIVLDVPLLFETGMDALCDDVWVMTAPKEIQIERIMKRNGKTRSQAEARIASQMPLSEKEERAGRVIRTDRPREETEKELGNLYQELLKQL